MPDLLPGDTPVPVPNGAEPNGTSAHRSKDRVASLHRHQVEILPSPIPGGGG